MTTSQRYMNEHLQLNFLSIHNYQDFSSIILDIGDDLVLPFTIISKQDGIDIDQVGTLFAHLAAELSNTTRPALHELTTIKLGYHALSTQAYMSDIDSTLSELVKQQAGKANPSYDDIHNLPYDKLEYELVVSKDGIELEHLIQNGKTIMYEFEFSKEQVPNRPDLLSKFVYVPLMTDLPDMTENIRDMILLPSHDETTNRESEVLGFLNKMLVDKIGYLDRPLQWSKTEQTILYYDAEHGGYLNISEASISIQAVIYVILACLNAVMSEQILVLDEFVGIPSSAKIICIAIFKAIHQYAKSTSHLIILDSEDYQAYKENVLTSTRVYKTMQHPTNDLYYITNKKLISTN